VKRAIQVAIGVAVSFGALWLTLRGKDLGEIWAAMRRADYRYLAPYFAILIAMHLTRTLRWGLLLAPVARIPFARLNAIAAVGYMALMLLPFRLGEFARPYLLAQDGKLRMSTALSSVVAERIVDGIFTGLLLSGTLLGVPDSAPGVRVLRAGGVIVSLVFAAGLAFLVVAYRSRALAVRIAGAALRPFSQRLAARAEAMLDAFMHGLRLLPGTRQLLAFLVLTLAFWGLNALGMKVLALGFGLDLGLVQSCALLGVLVVGIMIPAGPGMVGTFQGSIVVGLGLFFPAAVVATRGTAYANVLWAAQLVQLTGLGLFFLFSRHIQLGRVLGASAEIESGLDAEEAEYRETGR